MNKKKREAITIYSIVYYYFLLKVSIRFANRSKIWQNWQAKNKSSNEKHLQRAYSNIGRRFVCSVGSIRR